MFRTTKSKITPIVLTLGLTLSCVVPPYSVKAADKYDGESFDLAKETMLTVGFNYGDGFGSVPVNYTVQLENSSSMRNWLFLSEIPFGDVTFDILHGDINYSSWRKATEEVLPYDKVLGKALGKVAKTSAYKNLTTRVESYLNKKMNPNFTKDMKDIYDAHSAIGNATENAGIAAEFIGDWIVLSNKKAATSDRVFSMVAYQFLQSVNGSNRTVNSSTFLKLAPPFEEPIFEFKDSDKEINVAIFDNTVKVYLGSGYGAYWDDDDKLSGILKIYPNVKTPKSSKDLRMMIFDLYQIVEAVKENKEPKTETEFAEYAANVFSDYTLKDLEIKVAALEKTIIPSKKQPTGNSQVKVTQSPHYNTALNYFNKKDYVNAYKYALSAVRSLNTREAISLFDKSADKIIEKGKSYENASKLMDAYYQYSLILNTPETSPSDKKQAELGIESLKKKSGYTNALYYKAKDNTYTALVEGLNAYKKGLRTDEVKQFIAQEASQLLKLANQSSSDKQKMGNALKWYEFLEGTANIQTDTQKAAATALASLEKKTGFDSAEWYWSKGNYFTALVGAIEAKEKFGFYSTKSKKLIEQASNKVLQNANSASSSKNTMSNAVQWYEYLSNTYGIPVNVKKMAINALDSLEEKTGFKSAQWYASKGNEFTALTEAIKAVTTYNFQSQGVKALISDTSNKLLNDANKASSSKTTMANAVKWYEYLANNYGIPEDVKKKASASLASLEEKTGFLGAQWYFNQGNYFTALTKGNQTVETYGFQSKKVLNLIEEASNKLLADADKASSSKTTMANAVKWYEYLKNTYGIPAQIKSKAESNLASLENKTGFSSAQWYYSKENMYTALVEALKARDTYGFYSQKSKNLIDDSSRKLLILAQKNKLIEPENAKKWLSYLSQAAGIPDDVKKIATTELAKSTSQPVAISEPPANPVQTTPSPATNNNLLDEAEKLLNEGKYVKALEIGLIAKRVNPNAIDVRTFMANSSSKALQFAYKINKEGKKAEALTLFKYLSNTDGLEAPVRKEAKSAVVLIENYLNGEKLYTQAKKEFTAEQFYNSLYYAVEAKKLGYVSNEVNTFIQQAASKTLSKAYVVNGQGQKATAIKWFKFLAETEGIQTSIRDEAKRAVKVIEDYLNSLK